MTSGETQRDRLEALGIKYKTRAATDTARYVRAEDVVSDIDSVLIDEVVTVVAEEWAVRYSGRDTAIRSMGTGHQAMRRAEEEVERTRHNASLSFVGQPRSAEVMHRTVTTTRHEGPWELNYSVDLEIKIDDNETPTLHKEHHMAESQKTSTPPVRYVLAKDLQPNDIITDGLGVYRVMGVGMGKSDGPLAGEYVHVRVTTIAGYVRGGMMRAISESLAVFATVARNANYGVEGTPDA